MRLSPKSLLKASARFLLGDYAPYYIYQSPDVPQATSADSDIRPIDATGFESSNDEVIRAQLPYSGEQALAFGHFRDGRLSGVCIYWYGARYAKRNFWPLSEGEAKLVQIITTPEERGRGVARELITASHAQLVSAGFKRCFARIWHSNEPSIRAFERAGWTRIALVVEINPFRSARPVRLRKRL